MWVSDSCKHFSGEDYPTNPFRVKFNVLETLQVGAHCVARVHYWGCCVEYEGVKILVFKCTNAEDLRKRSQTDPNIMYGRMLSPFARFDPNEEGWRMAVAVALLLGGD